MSVADRVEVEITKPRPTIDELIAKSSIGAGLADIKARGADAHAADLARETRPSKRRKRPR